MSQYLLPGTNVLKNKLGLQIQEYLNMEESRLSMGALLTSIERIRKLDATDLNSLSKIHFIMFNSIYDWAGEYRTSNISKGTKMFHPVQKFDVAINAISNELANASSFSEIMAIYNDVNHLHPFREGNGRSSRVWLNLLLEQKLDKHISWHLIPTKVYMEAMKEDDASVLEKTFAPYLVDVDRKKYPSNFLKQNIGSYVFEGEYFSYEQHKKFKELINSSRTRDNEIER